ncbi:MAG: ribonuclease Z [Desulfatitalea sp.]|nr:ribonuclease Z [Desulfatitalea sp.]
MRPSFHPRLINGPFEDPGLLVNLVFRKQALLFDLGDLGALSSGDILKIDPVFVTHTHMDHFIGFDQLLRLLLGRAKRLRLFGPVGFLSNVAGKLAGYTWNLVHNYPDALVLEATEIDGNRQITQTFEAQSGFTPSTRRTDAFVDGLVCCDPAFTVRAACLDHHIPCLAFSLEERFHVNILKNRLAEMNLPTGPWLTRFKRLILRQADPDTPVAVPSDIDPTAQRNFTLGELAPKISRITRGQKIAYVADALYSPENADKIVTLAQNADHLYIEAAFLHREADIARTKHHLTARQAGRLARQAGVAQMTIFHHSPRYTDQAHLLQQEARHAFSTP